MSGDQTSDRREQVLDSALATFARHGYRRTSMEQVARGARISRPGLYFLFASKQALFRAAVTRSLEEDLAGVERALADAQRPLRERVVVAFDHWAGRYVGPLTRDVGTVIEDNPGLLGPIVEEAPQRFGRVLSQAVVADRGPAGHDVVQTLVSTSIGVKHQVDERSAYLERMRVAVDLLLRE